MRFLKQRKTYYSPGEAPPPKRLVSIHQYADAGSRLHKIHEESVLDAAKFPLRRGLFDLSPVTIRDGKEAYKFPSTFVAELQCGRVLERDGVVLTRENELLAETAVHFGRQKGRHRIFEHTSLPSITRTAKRVAVLASIDAGVYFHWMCNILPRLELLKRADINYDALYLPPLTRPYQHDSLNHLRIDLSSALFGHPGTHVEAEALIVPSLPAAPCDCPPWVVDYLRSQFLRCRRENTTPKRIYIGRKGARRRQVVNEDAVIANLTRRGFQEVFLEDLPVATQASLFAGAEAIIAPHGASLTNLVFCKPKTLVVEIFHPDWICDCYWQISNYLGLNHVPFLAKRGYRNLINRINDRNRDSFVDLSKLDKLLLEIWPF